MSGYRLRAPVTSRQVNVPLWRALAAANEPVSVPDLHVAIGAHPQRIQTQLKIWERGGLVQSSSARPRLYELTDRADRTAPPPILAWAGVARPRTPTARQTLWTLMRVLKRFDLPALTMASEGAVSRRSIEDYINVLQRAGYIVRERRSGAISGEWSVYVLRRRSGPRAPIVSHATVEGRLHRTLVDPNDATRHDVSPSTVSLRRKA